MASCASRPADEHSTLAVFLDLEKSYIVSNHRIRINLIVFRGTVHGNMFR